MAQTTMNVQLRQVIKTTDQWATWQESNSSKVIPAGLLCVEIDENSKSWVKVGDGTTAGYNALPYVTDGAIASLGQFMEFKGVVASYATLEQIQNPKVGDVYLVGTASQTPTANDFTEYVYAQTNSSGTATYHWEELGPIGMEVKPYVGGNGISITDETGGNAGKKVVSFINGSSLTVNEETNAVDVAIATDSSIGGVKTASTSAVTVDSSTGVIDVNTFSTGNKGLVPAPAVADDGKLLTTGGWTALTAAIAFDGTYDATNNKAATVSTVTDAINALDVSNITGFGPGKTLATLTETDGKIAATFQDISIATSQISDKDTKLVQSIKVNNGAAVTSISGGEIDLTGIATSVTVNGGTAVNPGNNGTVALTGIVTGATLNGSDVTVTNGTAALGGLAKTITYTASGTPGDPGATTGTINVSSDGAFDLSNIVLQCTL